MLGLSSSCDATVRLTRKASIPEKPGNVKEFVSLSGDSLLQNPRKILLYLRGEKAQTSKRVSIAAPTMRFQKRSYRGPRGILCTRGEKAQTSKRVSIAAPDNAISKAQLSGTPRDTMYPWGKGANKQKSEHCRPRQCDFKSAVCA